jgi:hypothetical protein
MFSGIDCAAWSHWSRAGPFETGKRLGDAVGIRDVTQSRDDIRRVVRGRKSVLPLGLLRVRVPLH